MRTFLLFILLAAFTPKQAKVLICKSGTAYAYHARECRGLNQCTHTIEKVTLAEAKEMRRTPCGYCYDKGGGDALPAAQCKAITKKGTQCSRKGSSNGYCWQHS